MGPHLRGLALAGPWPQLRPVAPGVAAHWTGGRCDPLLRVAHLPRGWQGYGDPAAQPGQAGDPRQQLVALPHPRHGRAELAGDYLGSPRGRLPWRDRRRERRPHLPRPGRLRPRLPPPGIDLARPLPFYGREVSMVVLVARYYVKP